MTEQVAISCRGVSKAFGDVQVLESLDLDVGKGETLVILGRSGTGKSVLLKHFNGLLKPDAGSVSFHGIDLSTVDEPHLLETRRVIGMLFQGGALFDSLTVGENVRFALDHHEIGTTEERDARVAELLALVDLRDTQAKMPGELSGGMRKRAALARALALQPECMLYDEPTTGLDPVTAAQINVLIRDLQSRFGLTSVVVTHDIASATYVADRVAFLYDGAIQAVGSMDELRRSTDSKIRQFLAADPLDHENS